MPSPTRILCPLDFSPPSHEALVVAASLARRFGAELHVLHAMSIPSLTTPDGVVMLPASAMAELSNAAQTALDAAVSELGKDLSVEASMHFGTPAELVVSEIEAHGIDMVVMGTHGRDGVRRLLMGSVAEKVLRASPVPVLVVPPGASSAWA